MTLAEVITRIPPATIERVVFDHRQLSEAQRNAIFKSNPNQPLAVMAEKLVQAYGDKAPGLAMRLFQQVTDINWETAKELSQHFKGGYDNQQASLVARIPNVSLPLLRDFLDSIERHICLIVAHDGASGRTERGTGFLIAAEFVLTCLHVFRWFRLDQPTPGSAIELHFDFKQGDQIDRIGLTMPGARKVQPAKDWLIERCDFTEPDGVLGDLLPADIQRISGALDFVLLRLSEPIGLQPLSRGGGKRRGWIPIPPQNIAANLATHDWIIIPQHPDGLPQRVDLGKYLEPDQTKTRIRYDTNTAPGTSGAPCFNQNFHLVGVHNARVGGPNPVANQAIRWDLVEAKVGAHLKIAPQASYVSRWSTSREGEPLRVVIGRAALLDWLRDSAVATPRFLADRVYSAVADEPSSGCSFSSEVLHAEFRDTKIPRAVYGQRGQQLPSTVEDLLKSLLRELEIDGLIEAMPKRPASAEEAHALPILEPALGGVRGGGEVDKKERWLSDELPAWLGRVINAHLERKFDARDAAKQAVASLQQLGKEVPEDVLNNSRAPNPIWARLNTWDFAYVVIDDLRGPKYPQAGNSGRTIVKGEVLSLIAALVKGKPEANMPSGLKRLRWMFLGYLPDFITESVDGNGAIVETLGPSKVLAPEIVAMLSRLSDTKLPLTQAWNQQWALISALTCVGMTDVPQPPPGPRLVRLQTNAGVLAGNLLKVVEG